MSDEKPPQPLTDLAAWFQVDPREVQRREIGEAQKRSVKRRRRKPKTQARER